MSSKSRNSRKQLENKLDGLCISLQKFLMLYYDIPDEVISKIDIISHKEVSVLIPDVETCDIYDCDIENIYIGDIIAVMDSYGSIEFYIPPKSKSLLPFCDYDNKEIISSEELRLKNLLVNDNLSRHDLVLLCRYYRKNNRLKEYRVVNKLLKERVVKIKAYRRKKFALKMKGRDEYD